MKTDLMIPEQSIADATGKTMVMLGGPFVYREFRVGDINCELKWFNGEPVMILFKYCLGSQSPAYMIEMNDAHLYVKSDGNASKELVSQLVHDAAKALNVENDRASIYRIITIIVDNIAELLKMPPEPKASEDANRPAAAGDHLTLIVDGKTMMEIEV